MKRTGNLIEKVADMDNLYLAFYKARKGKDVKLDVIAYRKNLDDNLRKLQQEILSGEVQVGEYHFFTIYEPKERLICAASFTERVLHHALMNICHPIFEKMQIFDSYATRKHKGTHAALHRATQHQQKYRWFLKMDVRKYFDSINHEVLFELIQRKIKDRMVLQIFKQIINSYEVAPGCGLPIGNLTSQYFANYYLSFVDRFIQQELKVSAYVRYMDDMVLWCDDKVQLLNARQQVTDFLAGKLMLALKISELNRSNRGLLFLGFRLFPDRIKLSRQSKKRFVRKAKKYEQYLHTNQWTEEEYAEHIVPLIANVRYADTLGLRRKLFENIGEFS